MRTKLWKISDATPTSVYIFAKTDGLAAERYWELNPEAQRIKAIQLVGYWDSKLSQVITDEPVAVEEHWWDVKTSKRDNV